ncbi:MAG: tetratricopeptide repeat protein, partial [Bacteroidales bacterium]|nr:tetratricopeptide repeat protein [Bacteroidales bacterium]
MIKRLLIIWLMMIPMWGLGQSKKANEYYNQGVKLFNTHRVEEAIQILKKSDALEKKELDESRPNRYRSERLIAMCWHQMASSAYTNGNYLEAVRIQENAVEVWERTNAPKNQNYIAMLNQLAACYNKIRNTNASISASLKSIEVIKSLSGEYNQEYTSALNGLAVLTCNAGRYYDAIKLGTQVVDISAKTIGERNALFAIYLSNLAGYYSLAGEMRQAFFYENRALAIRKDVLGEEDPQYATSLNNLANYISKLGNYEEAVRLESEAVKIRKAALGDRHPDYTFALIALASYNLFAGNYADAQKQFEECYNLLNSYVMLYFSSMTYQERSNFWSKYSNFFRDMLVYAADIKNNPQQTIL